ncbi:hypothetical protein BGZ47_004931 [Haplosporangium gracile]|nr:hypothetical protein BGZ47_004931 [Haplosporangium gracile]
MEIRHVFFLILVLVLFLDMSWVAYWNEGGWVYPLMDFKLYNWTIVGLGYAGAVVGMAILYCLLWKLHALKGFLGTRKERKSCGIVAAEGEKEEVPLVSNAYLPAHVPRTIA